MSVSHGRLACLLFGVLWTALVTQACVPTVAPATPGPAIEPPPARFVLTSYGGIWNDERLGVILSGIPFKDLMSASFPGRAVQLAVDLPGRRIEDASVAVPYDPGRAKELAYQTGLQRVILVTPQGDAEPYELAKRMVEQLQALGVEGNIVETPEPKTVLEQMTAAGEPALALWRG